MIERSLDRELRKINSSIRRLETKGRNPEIRAREYAAVALTVMIMLVLAVGAFYYGASVTGLITFSETVVSSEDIALHFGDSGSFVLEPDMGSVDSLMLSGKVSGEGRAAVFLSEGGDRRLVYYFEGDAGEGKEFSELCFETCHFSPLSASLRLDVELDGTVLDIDQVTYQYGKLIDFELLPLETLIDYDIEKAKVVDLVLTNGEDADYSVVLFIDGPLVNHFSWQGSMIKMSEGEGSKTIPVTVKLPSNLPEGEYVHTVSARYVPPGDYDFSGTAPVSESVITVINR